MIGTFAALLFLAEAAAAPVGADAEALFREGLKAYDAKEYARAIESFEAAHKLSPLPEILFDIAMARRALGDCHQAVAAFEGFIAAAPPDDPLLVRARARRAELGACAASDDPGASPPRLASAEKLSPVRPLPALTASAAIGAQAPATLIAHPESPPPPPEGRPWLRNTCFAAVGGTAALGIVGLAFGLQARSAQQEAERATMWGDAAARADERGRAFGQAATTLLISAGATTLVAAASCIATSLTTDR